MMHYVYILECNDKRYYVGCAMNFQERIERHKNGYVAATKNRLPIKLVVSFAFRDKYKAYAFEKYLKSGSGRAFMKRRLI